MSGNKRRRKINNNNNESAAASSWRPPPQSPHESNDDYTLRLYYLGFSCLRQHDERMLSFQRNANNDRRTRLRKPKQQALGLYPDPDTTTKINDNDNQDTAISTTIQQGLACFDSASERGDYEASLWLTRYYDAQGPTPHAQQFARYFERTVQAATDLWHRHGSRGNKRQAWKQEMENFLCNGAIALLDHVWLVKYVMQSSSSSSSTSCPVILPCRQELQERHPEAFLSVDDLIEGSDPEWTSDNWPIIVMTYMWLDPKHPDPRGQMLQLLVNKLKTLVDGRWGIFWDYASLYQNYYSSYNSNQQIQRSQHETDLFKKALHGMNQLYAHPLVTVLRIKDFPPDFEQSATLLPYDKRAWPFFEFCMAAMTSHRDDKIIDLQYPTKNNGNANDMAKKDQPSSNCVPPMTPARFERELAKRSFTNAKDDRPLILELYPKEISRRFDNVQTYNLIRQFWGDAEMSLVAEMIRDGHLPYLKSLWLDQNTFGVQACRELACALSFRRIELDSLQLSYNTNIGDEGFKAFGPLLPYLARLHLRKCGLGDDSCHLLWNKFESCGDGPKRLNFLDLSDNENITDTGCDSLTRLVKHVNNKSLNVRIDTCPRVSSEARNALLQALARQGRGW